MSPEHSVTYVSGPDLEKLVGAIGFEPTTPCAQGRCATRLRYAPTKEKPFLILTENLISTPEGRQLGNSLSPPDCESED